MILTRKRFQDNSEAEHLTYSPRGLSYKLTCSALTPAALPRFTRFAAQRTLVGRRPRHLFIFNLDIFMLLKFPLQILLECGGDLVSFTFLDSKLQNQQKLILIFLLMSMKLPIRHKVYL